MFLRTKIIITVFFLVKLILTQDVKPFDPKLSLGVLDFTDGGEYFNPILINYIFTKTNTEIRIGFTGKICYVKDKNALDLCLKLSQYITKHWVRFIFLLFRFCFLTMNKSLMK